eukprot:213988-Pyramimonas_sp.AAC.1
MLQASRADDRVSPAKPSPGERNRGPVVGGLPAFARLSGAVWPGGFLLRDPWPVTYLGLTSTGSRISNC